MGGGFGVRAFLGWNEEELFKQPTTVAMFRFWRDMVAFAGEKSAPHPAHLPLSSCAQPRATASPSTLIAGLHTELPNTVSRCAHSRTCDPQHHGIVIRSRISSLIPNLSFTGLCIWDKRIKQQTIGRCGPSFSGVRGNVPWLKVIWSIFLARNDDLHRAMGYLFARNPEVAMRRRCIKTPGQRWDIVWFSTSLGLANSSTQICKTRS